MNYYSLPNTPQVPNPNPPNPNPPYTSNPSHGEKTSNSFDSMFSFFTIPVPQAEQTSKSPRPVNQQIREGEKYFVLTSDLLRLKQSDAAARLDIHPSTFSKKWRQSLPDRKWPYLSFSMFSFLGIRLTYLRYRKHCKIERQIKKLKDQGDTLSEGQLKELVTMREKNLEPAVIVISDSDTTPQSKASTPQTAPTTSTTTNTATKTSTTSTPNTITATTPTTTTSTSTSTSTTLPASDPTKAISPIVSPLNTGTAANASLTSPQLSTLPPQVPTYPSPPPGGGEPPITPTHSILPLPSAGTEL